MLARITRFFLLLFHLTILFPLTPACLILAGTIEFFANPPTLVASLVDNGHSVCAIKAHTTSTAILPFSCVPGFNAYISPDASWVLYQNGGRSYEFENIKKWRAAQFDKEVAHFEARNFGCAPSFLKNTYRRDVDAEVGGTEEVVEVEGRQ